MSDPDTAYDDEVLAAEYVLHLLDEEARAGFEARARDDRALRDKVLRWEADLAPLADEIAPVTPSAAVKTRVMAEVAPTKAVSGPGRVWAALLGGAVAVALAAVVLFGGILTGPEERVALRAELSSGDGSLIVQAGVIPATHEIVLDRQVGAPPPGRVHELWLIAEGADAPVSLGLLEADGSTRIRVPDDIAPGVRTGTLAISDEPEGGSPTGAPTGDILATATLTEV